MTNAIIRAQPPLDFIPERFHPWVRRFVKVALPGWVRWQTDLVNIKVSNAEVLAQLYGDFQAGKNRFAIAFRHPAPEDAYGLAHLLWHVVPQSAKQLGINLQPVHSHFIYDRGIPLWAGNWVGKLCSRLGGVSIQRGKLDLVALKSARQLLANGRFPLAAAPEGGNNGHNEIVSPLEPGVSQLSFWCVEDLVKAERTEPVYIVPIGIQYRYINPPWDAIDHLLSQLETRSGIAGSSKKFMPPVELPTAQITNLYGRLYRLAEHLLTLMEGYYQQIYGLECPNGEAADANAQLATRLQHLLNGALDVAEKYFDLRPKGSVIDRCRRLEQAGWERIFREDLRDDMAISAVERGLADRIAEEADLRMWHMRLVESFVAVTGRYVLEKPTAERFAETVLLLTDMVTRLQGGNPFPRPSLGKREALLTVGEPICVSDRWSDYKQSRRKAVAALTKDLQGALEALIVDSGE
ncbi:1-acyl-sn-glycerol-3-phosphate acyltransferase [Leptothoe spongobia]|uniref:1-acyl-sn-glycerol-3-phosphate acyltransferase n=1 Tax=Leptothoe spongobia TAU-MAC 1115 TaxID=1967444 RepID=A0A947DEE1_9CYAN|nr:1-acyl-sn-glycerol-3-phosphate acyltransferase [Leptothoe spongobia]MBT9315518.1 1-acyl-sn-glycerol-3-phosphate acyltransferase [Leptothoe spongobia TAU-MAC 1115]